MNDTYVLGHSPHITAKPTVTRIMLDVIIALLPACIAAIYYFGVSAALTIVVTVAAAMATEAVIELLCKKPVTLYDLSAVVTGILLALNLPAGVPLYVPIVGAVFAIGVCKMCFGGLGGNFINPALAGRAMLMIAWPVAMTTYVLPGAVDTVASATPLAMMKAGELSELPSTLDMLLGNTAGSMGETCAIAQLLGGIYLLARRVISLRIPLAYLGTVAVLSAVTGHDVVVQLLSGGLMLGAFFMATDYVTSPFTRLGKLVFGIGLGCITCLIRFCSNMTEGVSFALLLMNLLVPYINELTRQKPLGGGKRK